MEELPIEPPRDLNYFLNLSKDGGKTSEDSNSKPTVKQYRVQHPTQDSDLQKWVEEHRILTKG
jgi:hypothetical protein